MLAGVILVTTYRTMDTRKSYSICYHVNYMYASINESYVYKTDYKNIHEAVCLDLSYFV